MTKIVRNPDIISDKDNESVTPVRSSYEELKTKYQEQLQLVAEKQHLENLLKERIKELSCIYGITGIIENSGNSIEKILQSTANLIPSSWQYPEISRARITLEGRRYYSPGFKISKWKQVSEISINGKTSGHIEVYYLEKMPDIDEGPFLKEERLLIDSICGRLGRACEKIRTEQQLITEQLELHNKNVALREVLSKVQEEKKEINAIIADNVDKIIMPIIYELENQLPKDYLPITRLLKTSLLDVTSPFVNNISRQILNLTPTEIQICQLIKNGLLTKDIARIRHISPATVNRHREKIRKKLSISNKAINLATYLMTFLDTN